MSQAQNGHIKYDMPNITRGMTKVKARDRVSWRKGSVH